MPEPRLPPQVLTEPRCGPVSWCLLGRKAGDNTQLRALCSALGWPVEERHIEAQPWELLTHVGLRRSLLGIDLARSSPLAPPWPELILSAGRRNEPVARWIRARAGGRTRLVHLGRPWSRLHHWDLIITTPQYQLPAAPNVLCNTLPLHCPAALPGSAAEAAGIDPDSGVLQAAASASVPPGIAQWQRRFAHLPRPWVVLLLGGDSGPFVFTADKGERLGRLSSRLAASAGGSVLMSNSARTPTVAMRACTSALAVPHFVHDVHNTEPAAQGHVLAHNPYAALLALADAFVVTGESMSMLAEAHAQTQVRSPPTPLFIFDPGDGDRPWLHLPHAWRYKPLSHRLAMRLAPARMRRDVGRIQSALVESGGAQWLDEGSSLGGAVRRYEPTAGKTPVSAADELVRSAAAVRALFPGY